MYNEAYPFSNHRTSKVNKKPRKKSEVGRGWDKLPTEKRRYILHWTYL